MGEIEFNVNDKVRVRLTDFGRRMHRRNHDLLFQTVRHRNPFPYQPPTEDVDGWSEWQMWDLMAHFGSHMSDGGHVPFETTIRIAVAGAST